MTNFNDTLPPIKPATDETKPTRYRVTLGYGDITIHLHDDDAGEFEDWASRKHCGHRFVWPKGLIPADTLDKWRRIGLKVVDWGSVIALGHPLKFIHRGYDDLATA